MRVFFDASIIIAALLSTTGGSAQLFKFVKAGLLVGITSQTVLEEIMEEDKPAKLKKTTAEIQDFIADSGLLVRKIISLEEIAPYQGLLELADAHLIAGAKLTNCGYLVTLDKKHLLQPDIQKKFLPLKIVSPKELLEEVVSG